MIELTEQQLRALEHPEATPPRVVNPKTKETFVLIRLDKYERLKEEEYDDSPWTREELEALAWSEVQTYVPAMKNATLIRSAVTRNPEATWLPKPGVTRASNATSDPRVAITGSWTNTGWPDTMESAVRSGQEASAIVILSVTSAASEVEGRERFSRAALCARRSTPRLRRYAHDDGSATHRCK